MFFKRRRRRREALAAAEQAQSAPMTGTEPWLAHGLHDGDRVACQSCGQVAVAQLHESTAVLIAVAGSLDGRILVCTGCGRLLCLPCSMVRDSDVSRCDQCGDTVVPPMK